MGTSPEAIDLAEDRDRFAAVLDELGIVYPAAGMASTYQEACVVADRIGFPLLVRPSYVLGGRGMGIVYDGAQLEKYMAEAAKISPDHPVYLDRFLEGAVEVDLDALCDGEQVFVGGNASLQLMYDTISKAYTHGLLHSERPWCREPVVKFLCPAPGYDRHFKVTESFGFELITIPMTDEGPDMDAVEKAIQDPAVKGMWNVPKYSNPDGIIYSAETIRRIASMKPAAPDFLLMWDNAYCIHEFEGDYVEFPDILAECEKYGNADMVFEFASTSKVTLPGAGISCFACSEANMAYMEKLLTVQVISFDKVNQQRHVLYLKDKAHTLELMKKHAAIMGPKFAGDCLLAAAQGRLLRLSERHARHRQADAGPVQGGGRHHDRSRRHLPLRQGPSGQQHPYRALPAPR